MINWIRKLFGSIKNRVRLFFFVNIALVVGNYIITVITNDQSESFTKLVEVSKENERYIERLQYLTKSFVENREREQKRAIEQQIDNYQDNLDALENGGKATINNGLEEINIDPILQKEDSEFSSLKGSWESLSKLLNQILDLQLEVDTSYTLTNDLAISPNRSDNLETFEEIRPFVEPDSLGLSLENDSLNDSTALGQIQVLPPINFEENTFEDILPEDDNSSFTSFAIILNPKVEEAYFLAQTAYEETLSKNRQLSQYMEKSLVNSQASLRFVLVITFIANLLVLIGGLFLIGNYFINPLKRIAQTAKDVATGDINTRVSYQRQDEIGEVADSLNLIVGSFKQYTDFAENIGKGNFASNFDVKSEKDTLGYTLLSMRDNLKNVADEDRRRNWANEGFALFSNILRSSDREIKELCYDIISNLVKYLDANQGGLFLLSREKEGLFLELQAAFAYNKRKYEEKIIRAGQGLLGQVVLEKELIYLEKVPDHYIQITSGLGRTNPRCLLLAPLKVNDEIYGALEIASFRMLENYELDFVEKLTENIASTISSVKINENTKMLLDETRLYAEQMQAQEEEMRQNMEELAATQEEMERNQFKLESYKENLEREVEKRTAELQDKENDLSDALYQLQGIIDSSTSGIIALDTNYQVRAANAQSIDMVSQLFGRQFEVGDNWLKIFEHTDRIKYSKQLWDRALGGEDFSLEDQYLNPQNGRHWVEVALDPIRNPQKDIIGASMFVRDITERKRSQKDIELTAHILDNSINEVYVFDAETLKFTTVNHRALKNLGYTLEEMQERSPYHIAPRFEKDSFQTFISPLQNGEEDILQLETKYYRKDGSTYDVELSLQYFKDEESALFAIIAQDISERKKNEKQLKEALERFDLATAATNEGIWEMPIRQNDPGNPENPAWWSRRFMLLIGIEDEVNLPPRLLSLINLIHHQDRELFQAALVAHLNDETGSTPFQVECRLQHREEGFIWFFASGETVRDEEGHPIKFAGSIRNINRRKEAEEQLSEQHAIMQGIFNAAINSIVAIDPDEQITFCNPVTEKIFGYTTEELIGKNFRVLLAQSHELNLDENPDQLHETEGRSKNGKTFPIEISLAHTEAFQKDLHILILRDVSERKEKEHRLKENEERLRRISEASTEGLFFHDNGIITDVNKAFTRITGFERNEVIGTAALEKLAQESKELAESSPILDQGGPHEVFFVRKDGQKILLELRARDIAQNGSLLKVVSLRDVKEGKRAEQEQNRLVQILDNFPNAVIYTDSSGNIRYINEAGVQLLGYEVAGEFFDKPLSMLHPQDILGRMYADWIPNSIRQGIYQVESVTLMKNGYALPVIQTIIPQMDQNNNVEFITFIFSRKG